MDIRDAIKILETHQLWRLGEIMEMPYSPRKITEALETIIERVKTMEKEKRKNIKPDVEEPHYGSVDLFYSNIKSKYKLHKHCDMSCMQQCTEGGTIEPKCVKS